MKRLLPFVLLILLVLGGFFAATSFFQPERHRQEIASALGAVFNRQVAIGPISMKYLPPTLQIEQVGVLNADGSALLHVGSAVAPLDWIALLHLKFAPQDIELHQWRLDIQRKADGAWDIEDFLPRATGLSGAQAWALREVRWKDGEIHWIDKFSGAQELVLTSIEGHWEPRPQTVDAQGTFTNVIPGTRLSLAAKGQFFVTPQWSGDLQLSDQGNTASFHITKTASATDLKGQVTRWSLTNAAALLKFYCRLAQVAPENSSAVMLESWQFHSNIQKSKLTFDHSAGLGGGLTEAKGAITRTPAGPLLAAELAAKDVPVGPLLTLAGVKAPLEGKVTLLIKGFQATLTSQAPSTVACEGSLDLKDGAYQIPETVMKKLAKAKTLTYIKQKFPSYAVKGVPVAKLSAHWKAKNGMADVDSARLVSTDIKAAWVGKVDIAKEGLDGYLRLLIQEKDPKKKRLLPLKYQTEPANGRLQGTVADWSLRSVPAARIPAATLTKLRKAVGH